MLSSLGMGRTSPPPSRRENGGDSSAGSRGANHKRLLPNGKRLSTNGDLAQLSARSGLAGLGIDDARGSIGDAFAEEHVEDVAYIHEMRMQGHSASDLRHLGVSAATMRDVGFSARELRAAKYTQEQVVGRATRRRPSSSPGLAR